MRPPAVAHTAPWPPAASARRFTHPAASIQRAQQNAPQEILFLGSGDFSGPLRYAYELQHQGTPFKMYATELATQDELERRYTYDRFHENWEKLEAIGSGSDATITVGLDATAMAPYVPEGTMDRIVFENPHSGDYGSELEPMKYHLAVSSNRDLLVKIFAQAARALRSGGTFELTVCGWPYLSNPIKDGVRQGMRLDTFLGAFAIGNQANLRLQVQQEVKAMRVSRNSGDSFVADGYKLIYKKP